MAEGFRRLGAVAVVASAALLPAQGMAKENPFIEHAAMAVVATTMCGYDGDNDFDAAVLLAVQRTGYSLPTVTQMAKARAFQIVEYVYAHGTRVQFCRNIYRGKWH